MNPLESAEACLRSASAWSCWWAGHQIGPHVTLVGLSLVAWARIGMLLQFLAGAFILLEIAGEQSIKGFAERARSWPTPLRRANLSLLTVLRGFGTFVKAIPKLLLLLSVVLMPVGLAWELLAHLGVVSPAGSPYDALGTSVRVMMSGDVLAARVMLGVFLFALATVVLLSAYSLIVAAITKLVEGASAVVSYLGPHPKFLSWAKLGSWLLFVLGFWLDFLVS